jgi:hypothetical protein
MLLKKSFKDIEKEMPKSLKWPLLINKKKREKFSKFKTKLRPRKTKTSKSDLSENSTIITLSKIMIDFDIIYLINFPHFFDLCKRYYKKLYKSNKNQMGPKKKIESQT